MLSDGLAQRLGGGPRGDHGVPRDRTGQAVFADPEAGFRVTELASDFEVFVRGLVSEQTFDTTDEDLARALDAIERGSFSSSLEQLLQPAPEVGPRLRRVLRAVAESKGYFALHADPLSHTVYDLVFDLFSRRHVVRTSQDFLDAYPKLLAFGDGDVSTGG